MPFLKAYKPLFNIYLTLGVCPFSVNLTKNTVECSILSLCYTILLFISLSIALLYFWVLSTLRADFLDTCDSGTCSYALIIQSLIIFVLFIIQSLHTFFHRSDHAQLLNGIVEMERNVDEHFGIEIFTKELVRKICVRNSLFVILQYALNVSAIYGLEMNQNFNLSMYHYLFAVEMSIIGLTVVHVIAICSILKQCSQLLLNEVKQLIQEPPSVSSLKTYNPNIKIYQIFKVLDTINEFKFKMCSVFGFRLLINQSMDFILLTVAVYYFMLVNIQLNFRFNWMQVYFMPTYLLPVIFKNFALVVTTDTLGNQVNCGEYFFWSKIY